MVLEFLLVPDKDAGRRVRRRLAETTPCSGVLVGTWSRLLRYARKHYFIAPDDDSEVALMNAMAGMKDAFWSKSFKVAPAASAREVCSALEKIIAESDPDGELSWAEPEERPDRVDRRVQDLVELSRHKPSPLPGELVLIKQILKESRRAAVHPIRVYQVAGQPRLTVWQAALVAELNRDAGGPTDDHLQELLTDCLTAQPRARENSALALLQRSLFEYSSESAAADASVQWVAVRDVYQEAELAAGMVQTLLSEDPDLKESDVGVLVPDSLAYQAAVGDAFGLAGIPLSGLSKGAVERDLGREAVFNFLFCRQQPTPKMAEQALLSSPLLPKEGTEERTTLEGLIHAPDPRKDPDQAEPSVLHAALGEFLTILQDRKTDKDFAPALVTHFKQAADAVGKLQKELDNTETVDWPALRRLVTPEPVVLEGKAEYTLQGVTVIRESREPWRDVRHLFVLGFNASRYPAPVTTSSVFFDDELPVVQERLGLIGQIPTAADDEWERRMRVRRQLCSASDTATFLLSHFDAQGNETDPSSSFAFMEQLLGAEDAAKPRVLYLDDEQDRNQILHLARAEDAMPQAPRALLRNDDTVDLHQNLLVPIAETSSSYAPSPSSLDRLLVSPLHWLLKRVDALPKPWETESLTPLLSGLLVHELFDKLFEDNSSQRSLDQIRTKTENILREEAREIAPFLLSPHWGIELKDLIEGASHAAFAWQGILSALGNPSRAMAEESMSGLWNGEKVWGRPDAIFESAGKWRLIVDFKWSSSAMRIKRMKNAYELQASVYRAMDQGKSNNEVLSAIAYFTLKDKTCLSDVPDLSGGRAPGWTELGQDISSEATRIVLKRLDEVRGGTIRLNNKDDQERLIKLGVGTYALGESPLVMLFAVPEEQE